MGLSDRFNGLAKQAQEAVAEHKEQLHDAVDVVSAAANEKTHGRHAAKIAKMSERAAGALDKLGPDAEEAPATSEEARASSAEVPATSEEQGATSQTPGEPAGTAAEPSFPSFEE